MKKIVLLAAAFVCFSQVYAENVKDQKLDSLNSVRNPGMKSVMLQNVQVVSTRANQKTPMAFQNLDKKDIKAVNYGQDIPFLLTLTPSVTVSSDAGTGIGYTGIHVRGTDPSRINITTNGIPMNDAESHQVYWVNMPDFASSLESIQVQRGAGTSTNGGGAFGATVNMQTENVGVKPFASVDLSAGSYGSHKETLRFGTGLLDGHWGFQGRLSNIGSDGYIDRASVRLNSYFLQGGYFSDKTVVKFITFNGTEKTYHAWNYASLYEMEQNGRTYNSCGEYSDNDGNRHYYKDQTDNYHQQHYQLLWNQIINPNLNLNVAFHYTHGFGYYEEYKERQALVKYTLATDKQISNLVRRKLMDNDFFGTVASLNYDNHDGLTLSLGGGWNKYHGKGYGQVIWVKNYSGDLDPNHEYYNNIANKYDGNIYGKIGYELFDKLNVYLDLQYRHIGYELNGPTDKYKGMTQLAFNVNDKYDFFNPKFGLYYKISDNHQVYASFAVAQKEPTRDDYKDNLGSSIKAERLYDWELGYKFQSQQFSAGVNLYYMNYKNQFVMTGELNDIGEAMAKNIDKSYREGIELQAAYKPVDWFRWDVNATFSRNRAKNVDVTLSDGSVAVLDDTPLSFSPGVILNNVFSFTYKGFKANIHDQYVGKQYFTNTGLKSYTYHDTTDKIDKEVSMMLDAYFVTNLDLSYTFRLKGLKSATIGCTIYNLFSEKYESNGWSAPSYTKNAAGNVVAVSGDDDPYETGLSAQAPINFMAHLSINF